MTNFITLTSSGNLLTDASRYLEKMKKIAREEPPLVAAVVQQLIEESQ